MIVLKPKGGLCNRLRTIDSGIVLAREINRPLKILWTLSPELNCSFQSLFELPDNTTVVDIKPVKRPSFGFLKQFLFLYDYGICRIKYPRVIFQSQLSRLLEEKYDFTQLRNFRSVFITCCNRFYTNERRFQPLKTQESIRSIVNNYSRDYSSYTVGVHIRRTDHQIAKASSPDEGFMHAMDQEIQMHPEVKFFLASDCPEVMSRFVKQYKDRVIWHPKEYSRDSEKGVQDALVDLLCLSKTKKIIGSVGSSFSGTASLINDIPSTFITGPKT
jgi:hypothetical protein